MCFSKISNAWTAKPASDAAAPIDGENRLAAFKGYALANLNQTFEQECGDNDAGDHDGRQHTPPPL